MIASFVRLRSLEICDSKNGRLQFLTLAEDQRSSPFLTHLTISQSSSDREIYTSAPMRIPASITHLTLIDLSNSFIDTLDLIYAMENIVALCMRGCNVETLIDLLSHASDSLTSIECDKLNSDVITLLHGFSLSSFTFHFAGDTRPLASLPILLKNSGTLSGIEIISLEEKVWFDRDDWVTLFESQTYIPLSKVTEALLANQFATTRTLLHNLDVQELKRQDMTIACELVLCLLYFFELKLY